MNQVITSSLPGDEPTEYSYLEIPPLSEPKCGFSAVVYDKTNIVVLGGENSSQYFDTVFMFDTINNKWIELPSMPTARCDFAAGVAGSTIIAAGGFNSESINCIVEIMDMKTRT